MDSGPTFVARSWRSVVRDGLRAWLITGAMLACTLVIGGLLQAGASLTIPSARQDIASGAEPPAVVFVVRALATEVGLLLPAAVLLVWGGFRIRWRVSRSDLGACAGALVAVLSINGAGSWLMTRIGEPYGGFPSLEGDSRIIAVAFFCAVILAPIAEEIYFREALLCRVFARSSRPYALAVTALVFGALHASAGGPVLLASLSLLGVVLGWVRLRTGSIGAAIAVHATHNALACLFTAAVSKGP